MLTFNRRNDRLRPPPSARRTAAPAAGRSPAAAVPTSASTRQRDKPAQLPAIGSDQLARQTSTRAEPNPICADVESVGVSPGLNQVTATATVKAPKITGDRHLGNSTPFRQASAGAAHSRGTSVQVEPDLACRLTPPGLEPTRPGAMPDQTGGRVGQGAGRVGIGATGVRVVRGRGAPDAGRPQLIIPSLCCSAG